MPEGSAVIVKHNNPCGAASKGSPADSYRAAFACDEVSAFGGIVAFHGEADVDAAGAMADVFTEVVVAPSYTPAASAAFAERPNLRVVAAPIPGWPGLDVRPLPGGALVQDRDVVSETRAEWKVVSSREPTAQEWADLELAWTIAWRVKSNTIVLVRGAPPSGWGRGRCRASTRRGSRPARRAIVRGARWWPATRSSCSPTRSRCRPTPGARR